MIGIRDLIVTATWPEDGPARRQARGILYLIVFIWVALLATPFLIAGAYGGK